MKFGVVYTNSDVREVLSAARTYYVRKDGNDNFTGLTNASGTADGAFLTIQKALNVYSTIDSAGYLLTIQVGDGTYTEALILPPTPTAGVNVPILSGNTTTPASVILNPHGYAITSSYGGQWKIIGFTFANTSASAIYNSRLSAMYVKNCTFSQTSGSYGIVNRDASLFTLYGNIEITTNHLIFCYTIAAAISNFSSYTIVIKNTPAWGWGFVFCDLNAMQVSVATFSGTATGVRYSSTMNSSIQTYGLGVNHFPGNSAGTTATGGQYA